MSYTLSVQNGTPYQMEASDGATVPSGATWQPPGVHGNAWIASTELGALNFLDIAARHIPGDSTETWGVLISFQGEEVVGRYEGAGALTVAFNEYGQAELAGMDLRQVSLPSFIFTQS
jgi:hypothetical protein